MRAVFSPQFKQRAKKLPAATQRKLKSRLALFMEDPYNSLLENTAFAGDWGNYRTISIAAASRAVFQLLPQDTAYFIDLIK
jgi:hypothetical protein